MTPKDDARPLQGYPVLSSRAAPVLALLAGAALPLAFAPVGWAWLAVIAPAVLFAVAAVSSRRQALWSGYLFGLGYYGVGISWIYVSIGRYGHSGPVLAVILTAVFVAFMALFCLLAVYLARRLRSRPDFLGLVVAFPVAWLLVEWLRTWFMTGFPWLLLGYSQTGSPLAGLAPVLGVLGVSAALAFAAGALAWWWLRLRSLRFLAPAAVLAVTLVAGAFGLRHHWSAPAGEPLAVALLQGNIAQDKKWSEEWRQHTLDLYRELTARHWGADLIIWPEAAIPAWFHQVRDDYLADLAAEGALRGSDLVIGIPYFDPRTYKAYNSVISLGPQAGVYHKRHLVPFGEYLPLREVFGRAFDILGAPMSDFAWGERAQVLHAAGRALAVSVCYEVVYGPSIAEVLPESELLVNVSNDAWFGDSLAPHQHLQMARMRAIETERWLLRATNTGLTAVADERGRVVAQAPQFEVATLTAVVEPRTGATPYVRWADWPLLALLVGLVGLLLLRRSA